MREIVPLSPGQVMQEVVLPPSPGQVMEEIIAKSKAFKAAKSKQREEDCEELDALDAGFKELAGSAALRALYRPTGANK